MPNFFIDRPIFAWVIAIIIMLAGGLAILKLPVAQYPTIAPPAVTISATYPGRMRNGAGYRYAGYRTEHERYR